MCLTNATMLFFVYDVPTNTPITKAQLMLTKNRKNNILQCKILKFKFKPKEGNNFRVD